MGVHNLLALPIWRVKTGRGWIGLFGVTLCLLLLAGCGPGGDQVGDLPPPATPSAQVERHAVENLVQLYRQAFLQKDIDRLQDLLQPDAAQLQASPQSGRLRQSPSGTFVDLTAFRQTIATTFQTHTVTALTLSPEHGDIASDLSSVSFLEIESTEEAATLTQQTRVYRTRFELVRSAIGSTVSFRIGAVTRQGPLVLITTPGRVQAGTPGRVTVRDPSGLFTLATGRLPATAAGSEQTLLASGDVLSGTFPVAPAAATTTIQIDLQSTDGETLSVTHTLRLRQVEDRTVQPIAGTSGSRLQAVTVAGDGTVWAGGRNSAALYRVAAGSTDAELVGQLVADPTGRIEDLLEDDQGRLQAVIFGQQTSGVVVHDQGVFCQTVNGIDPSYPFRTPNGQPGVSTRATGAGAGAIWLHGSDDGIAQVTDNVPPGQCPDGAISVTYNPVLRREDGLLPSNTVPALLARADGTLWVGSALGLARLQSGQLTRVSFDPELSFQGNPATLEAFFAAVAQAIAAAKPLDTIEIGDVSFIEAFGAPLIKADLIFSLAEDGQGRLWVGTFGGGVRRVEAVAGKWQDTLHLTREDGLAGNIVFGLAVAQDGTVWVATDDGVSQIQEIEGALSITNYTALDGLTLPARDIAVDAAGAAWVATDGGLFRIASQGGEIVGVVQDKAGQPVADADVVIFGTPFHAVTDAQGQFSLSHLPAGSYQLLVDGQLASGGPFALAVRQTTLTNSRQPLPPIIVPRASSVVSIDPGPGGRATFPLVPGAALDVPPQDGTNEPIELRLAFLDATALPSPLPSGFTAVAVAELQSNSTTFSPPATLSLPNYAGLPVGQLVVLMRFDDLTQRYEQLGLGRVREDGMVIETLSGGLRQFSTVVFAAADADATKVFLVPVSGNNQQVQPGQETLTEPLVVRLEDQFGNPVVGENVTATIVRGDWTIVAPNLVTDAQGEARFEAQTGGTGSGADFVVQVAAPDLANVRPVQLLAIVGEADTPDIPHDIAVLKDEDIVLVADRLSGLQVIDVRDPTQPIRRHRLALPAGLAWSLAIDDTRAYVGTGRPLLLYVVDLTNPRDPDFAADADQDGVADRVLASLDFQLAGHFIKDIDVQGERLYAISNTFSSARASLYIVDIQDPIHPRLLSSVPLPTPNPTGLAVVGHIAYVTAEVSTETQAAGLLLFDVRDAANPVQLGSLGDPDPADAVDVVPSSDIAIAGTFAYLVETQRDAATDEPHDFLTVFDLNSPEAPRRRGSAPIITRPQLPLFATGLTVAAPFAYVARGFFGLQAVDVRDPDDPRPVGFVQTPSEALQVATAGAFIYVTDQIFGLQAIRGPDAIQSDTDGDGVVDFFDAFPTAADETLDTDDDRLGDNVDVDDDNDGFTDLEEANASPPTDAKNPLSFPVGVPPLDVTTVFVDAATTLPVREHDGTSEAPYHSISEALQALRSGRAPQVTTLLIRPGTYAPFTTRETFPIDLGRLSHLTVQAEAAGSVVLDAAFRADVINVEGSADLRIAGLVLMRGAIGISVRESSDITLRNNQLIGNTSDGIRIGLNANVGIEVTDNRVEDSGNHGIQIVGNAAAVVRQNTITTSSRAGIVVTLDSTAELIENLIDHSIGSGIAIVGADATLRQNTTTANGGNGVFTSADAVAELVDNTITDNAQSGVWVADASFAALNGGIIAQNGEHGIRVGRRIFLPAAGMSTATVGLNSDAVLEIIDNGGAGIFVEDDGSKATIDSRNIVLDGDIEGEVIDVAP